MLPRPKTVFVLLAAAIVSADLLWNQFSMIRPRMYQLWQWTAPRVGFPVNDLSSEKYLTSIENATGAFEIAADRPIFLNRTVSTAPQSYASAGFDTDVLGTTTPEAQEKKWIEVDISKQHLYAHEGDKVVFDFPVSTGKWAPTPEGEFRIWIKLRYHRMIGGSLDLGTFYDLPNVPYVMYFYQGYGLHGAYWHNNFGQPMSHGCVNISIPDSRKVFEWAGPVMEPDATQAKPTAENPGTRVVVHS